MIITQTPHRISFFGGGTDYPGYYLKHGGKVLGGAIDKYCYLNVRRLPPFFKHKHRIVYSLQENVNELSEIQHPSVRETLKHLGIEYGVSIHHDGDIPAFSGMGSSSAFTVGLLNGLMALDGRMISKHELAMEAIFIEQQLIKENVGSQDQTFAAHGGLNVIEFLANGEIVVTPVVMPRDRLAQLESRLLLFFSGTDRIASDVAAEQVSNIGQNEATLHQMKAIVDEGVRILTTPETPLVEFGRLLHRNWILKRKLSSRITTRGVDEMYDKAIAAGATGGKLLGAGGGGFVLIFVEPECRASVCGALAGYIRIPVKFDFNGSKIIVYQPDSPG